MIKFVAYVNEGLGCDYTIACGKVLWEIEAKDFNEATMKVKHKVLGFDEDESCYDDDVLELKSITLYEVVRSEAMPLDQWYNDYNRQLNEDREIKEKEERRKKYEALRAEFE